MTPAATVVASYDERARFARAEAVAVRRPRLLRGLLDTATHVVEIPCGAGHFLASYARSDVAVTLADANAAMLAVAVEHAGEAGLRAERTYPIQAYWHDLTLAHDVNLVVVPNAAVNQLACQTPLAGLLTQLSGSLRPGAEVLAQVACIHPGGRADATTFYDPARPHRAWFADRWFNPAQTCGAALRRRCQHRDGTRLNIAFDYQDPAGASLYATVVELELFSAARLTDAFTTAGFSHVRFLPGQGGLSEVVATVGRR